jgi:hypothetical protein
MTSAPHNFSSRASQDIGLLVAARNRRRARGIATWMSYAGPPITATVAVGLMHLSLLLWIFLRIGG